MQFRAWVDHDEAVRTVRLAGRLGREHTAELLRICGEAPGPLQVDLASLVSADQGGLETLAALEGRGARLTGVSPYLALRLDAARATPTKQHGASEPSGGANGERRRHRAGGPQGREAQ